MAKAVIYAPDRRDRWIVTCDRDIEAAGDELAGIAPTWGDAVAMVESGEAEVIVVAQREHLPAGAIPPVRVAEGRS